jgi:stage II sporulation protein D
VIATRFAGPLQSFGRLEDLQITERDPSGRARAFALVTDRGNAIVSGSAFRLGVGPRTLRSLLLTNVQRAQDNSVSIEGGGLGHGVGLCQWGSHGMALAGHQAAEILGLYFPGTVVEDLNR